MTTLLFTIEFLDIIIYIIGSIFVSMLLLIKQISRDFGQRKSVKMLKL